MKLWKTFGALLISMAIFIFGGRVSADIIMLPFDDEFYNEHSGECEVESYREYTVTVDCDVMDSPVGSNVIRTAWEGRVIGINTFYTDENGVRWGYDYDDRRNSIVDFRECGWLKMENLQVVYDGISFMEEHKGELAEYAGELGDFPYEGDIYLWEYPGSQKLVKAMPAHELFPEERGTREWQLGNKALYVYTDVSGDKWVYIEQRDSGWIYAPDPCADLYSEAVPVAVVTTDIPAEEAEKDMGDFFLPVILAVAAAAVSGALICISRKKADFVPGGNISEDGTVNTDNIGTE